MCPRGLPPWCRGGRRVPTAARAALAQSTKGANKGIGAKMQGHKGETKELKPLLEPRFPLESAAGTLVEPPFWAGTPAGTPLSALLVFFGSST